MRNWILAAALSATATTTHAQNCAPHLALAQGLAERFQEGVVARGLQGDGYLF